MYDDILDDQDFFRYISNLFSTGTGTKRRINRPRSRGFRNENLNIRKGRYTTDLIKDKLTREVYGSNKNKNKFDRSENFNSSYFIDNP